MQGMFQRSLQTSPALEIREISAPTIPAKDSEAGGIRQFGRRHTVIKSGGNVESRNQKIVVFF